MTRMTLFRKSCAKSNNVLWGKEVTLVADEYQRLTLPSSRLESHCTRYSLDDIASPLGITVSDDVSVS